MTDQPTVDETNIEVEPEKDVKEEIETPIVVPKIQGKIDVLKPITAKAVKKKKEFVEQSSITTYLNGSLPYLAISIGLYGIYKYSQKKSFKSENIAESTVESISMENQSGQQSFWD